MFLITIFTTINLIYREIFIPHTNSRFIFLNINQCEFLSVLLFFLEGLVNFTGMTNEFFYKNIFLAEDDEDDVYIFEQALEELYGEAKLTARENGKELMDLLDRPPVPGPDIIFLDLNMPIKSGYECLKEIREGKQHNVPVVVLTTTGNAEDIDKMYKLGATHFIVKPNNFPDSMNWSGGLLQPERKQFVISA
jgi:CheY-like chemotaxis protein